ncbi:MAG: aminotransferase class I/II-fold pyridoxal phosphate-dependent enzyme, partial [Candidatus Magnetoovum sp. WYHC-5]|nr:aminotransferase class I/II-fold pyridoxal phosphate-dependent enzyme [Candidatus Magnetoovum sp. WYHC-5]
NIMVGNGSTELIYLIMKVVKPSLILLLAPTFSEYERAAKIEGVREIRYVFLQEKEVFKIDVQRYMEAMEGCEVAFLCNPNSPTASYLEKDEVLQIAKRAAEVNCLLVVDEAFVDFLPYISVQKEVEANPNLLVLYSMTKFYALSGLRLGLLFFHKRLSTDFRMYKEPWTVNLLAQKAGAIALKDKEYVRRTFLFLKAEKQYVEKKLRQLNIHYYPSKINFYLLRHDNANVLYNSLKKTGILIRDCSNYYGLDENFLRIGISGRRQNAVLFRTIAAMKTKTIF